MLIRFSSNPGPNFSTVNPKIQVWASPAIKNTFSVIFQPSGGLNQICLVAHRSLEDFPPANTSADHLTRFIRKLGPSTTTNQQTYLRGEHITSTPLAEAIMLRSIQVVQMVHTTWEVGNNSSSPMDCVFVPLAIYQQIPPQKKEGHIVAVT